MAAPSDFNPQPRRPLWGVVAPARKSRGAEGPIIVAPTPAEVILAVPADAAGRMAPGRRVRLGEPLGGGVHASVSGSVVAVGPMPVPGHPRPPTCVQLRSDGLDEPWPAGSSTAAGADAAHADARLIREQIAAAGILGLGGALFPTAEKLERSAGATTLLLNGAECEPYISCDDRLLRERAGAVVSGGRILLAALGAQRCIIAVKSDMPAARVAVANALAELGDPRFGLSVVTARYPAGGERQLIELVLGREVPAGGLPADVDCVCQNVATAAAVADLFDRGRPLVSRIVTVTGGGIARPCNIEARLGTPIRDLVALAGGYRGTPRRLIMGGPMMGIALPDDGLPITAATNCLLFATDAELGAPAPELACIRCGDCARACPARLQPQELLRAARAGDAPLLAERGVAACIECGACDYVCPSHIPLTGRFAAAKLRVDDWQRERARADDARRRHEARVERLAREQAAREAELADQQPEISPGSLAELLARKRGRPDPPGGGD